MIMKCPRPVNTAPNDYPAMKCIRDGDCGCMIGKRAWEEYDSAAEWCAIRSKKGTAGDLLPTGLSAEASYLINEDPDAFSERVRASAYALSYRLPSPYS